MWPLCSQKNTTTTMKMQHESATTTTTVTTTPTTTMPSTKSLADTSSTCNCCCVVTKLMRKLKRRSRTLSSSRQGSFKCCYDPLSYSLNFDTTGCGSLLDEDYYKFYAFSSRFVASNPRTSCPVVQVAAGNSH